MHVLHRRPTVPPLLDVACRAFTNLASQSAGLNQVNCQDFMSKVMSMATKDNSSRETILNEDAGKVDTIICQALVDNGTCATQHMRPSVCPTLHHFKPSLTYH